MSIVLPAKSGKARSLRPLAACLLIATTCSNSPPPQTQAGLAATPVDSARAAPAGLRAAYIATTQAEASAEYRFQSHASEFFAENPVQRFQQSGLPDGVRLTAAPAGSTAAASAAGAAERRLELSLEGLVCSGALTPLSHVSPQATNNRVEYRRAEVTEWYVNGPLGIEQGFTVPRRPRCFHGDGLELEVSVGDAVVPTLFGSGDSLGSYVELRDRQGKPWLRYSDVYAFDAHGDALLTQISVRDGRIRLHVDDSAAEYPITIDPLVWTVQQQLIGSDTTDSDFFGRSVALSGDTAVIGAFNASLTGKPNAGAAYVFLRSGTLWSQQQKLTAPDAAQDAAFGYAVALSGDTTIIGAPGAAPGGKSEAGSAYIFTRSGTTWTLQKQLAASDSAEEDQFGDSVAIDGDSAVVGADYADIGAKSDAGAVYVYVRSGTAWSEQKKLSGSDSVDGDHFGQAIAISGNSVVAGAPYADAGGKSSAGVAYVYLRSGTTWNEQQKVLASDAGVSDGFGSAVALATDNLIVGSPGADVSGKVDAGAAYFFARSGTTWTQKQKLTAQAPAASDAFGQATALSGSNALIGADGTAGGGASYVFSLSGMTFTQQQAFTSPLIGADGNFGRGIALDTDTGIVGAPFSTVSGKANCGVAIALALGMTKANGQICASNAECTMGNCVDGVCCNSACGGGAADCQACSIAAGAPSDGTCATAKMGTTCRAANGACDVAESCDGAATTCPTDKFQAAMTMCRAAAGLCDVAEYCSGTAAACPNDNLKPVGSECRAAIGSCDIAETCSGVTIDCPADAYKPNTTECRPAAGLCDIGDFCTGSGPSCPTDQLKPATTPCRAAAGLCDAEEACTGTSADCPMDVFKKSGTECRAAAGLCDAAETCSGASADCPLDAVKPNTTECRPAAGLCDSAEFCSGTTTDCPADTFKPGTAVCRPVAGPCDVSEYCSGGSPSCPADSFLPSATSCRAATGVCDVAESCTGSEAACPDDSFHKDGTGCTGGSCQVGMCRQEADMKLALIISSPVTRDQQPVSVQVGITNLGPAGADTVKLTMTVPAGAAIMNGRGDGWLCQPTDTGLSCERLRLDNGAGATLSADVIPPKELAMFTVDAQVAAGEFDPDTTNNEDSAQIRNDSPIHEGGCAMAPGRVSSTPGYAGMGLLMLIAAALRRRRRA